MREWDFSLAKVLIVVTGMPGSGKDEFIKVAMSLGFKDYHMGNTVRKYAKEANVGETDHDIGSFASGERKKHGMDIWAVRTLQNISAEHDKIIIDGLRNTEELEYFKRCGEQIKLVSLLTNRQTRLERILKRRRPDDVESLEELVDRDERELSWGIGTAIVLADVLIVNDSTLEEFKAHSREVIQSLSGD